MPSAGKGGDKRTVITPEMRKEIDKVWLRTYRSMGVKALQDAERNSARPTTNKSMEAHLSDAERTLLRAARSMDETNGLTFSQHAHAAQLQRALKALPLEVILNHISVALDERPDFDLEQAQRFASMVNDKVWAFY